MRRLLCSLILSVVTFNAVADISDINRIYRQTPGLDDFDICYGGGCSVIANLALSDDDWQSVMVIFASDTDDAEQEREQIARAIGVLEKIVGAKTGTSADRAGTFNNSNYPNQLDCNDEAINTTTYMRLMYQQGLIKLHEIEDTRTRNFFFNGWPHTTAVIREKASKHRYAVDSWFYDNGMPATIVPFEVWKSGYFPEDSPIRH